MANYQGSNGTVKIKSGANSLTAIADVRTWDITLTRDTVENTAMGDDFRKHLKGLQSYSGSLGIVYTDSEAAIVSTALNPDTDAAVSVELFVDATVTASKFAGEIIITGFSVSASYDGLIEATVEFTGNGAPTTVPVL
jgi:predicted secreted protein